ncbi:hypothetical protein DL764_008688 [Monosporascus ibericus]|uniref:F-box domain-containing protein n=1 Tax=Monosporascus ibericus TaxID=155417 RepID=A0A4Q4SWV4_9PEZI|nr:hypothetical protein DL764_008688 [Monosporascus ibericus]
MESSSLTATVLPSSSGLLALPCEIRLEIYSYLFSRSGVISDNRLSPNSYNERATIYLRVCKKFHEDIVTIIYRKIHVVWTLDFWVRFFDMIGPCNASLIKEIKIEYFCQREDRLHSCRGGLPPKDGKWDSLFARFKSANLNPKVVRASLLACPRGRDWLLDSPRRSDTPRGFTCHTSRDLEFLRHLSQFGRVQQFELYGDFNPTWAFYLKQRFGFVILQKKHPCRGHWVTWTLIKPDCVPPHIDMAEYTPSKSIKGFYHEI